MDRHTRCILGWSVVWTRTQEDLQRMVDEAPKAHWYYSDGFGITLEGTRFRWARQTPIRWKAIMSSTAITWHGWRASRVVFHVAPTLWNVPCVCSCIVSTKDNSTNNNFQTLSSRDGLCWPSQLATLSLLSTDQGNQTTIFNPMLKNNRILQSQQVLKALIAVYAPIYRWIRPLAKVSLN